MTKAEIAQKLISTENLIAGLKVGISACYAGGHDESAAELVAQLTAREAERVELENLSFTFGTRRRHRGAA